MRTTIGTTPGGRPPGARRWAAGLAWALWTLVLLGLSLTPWLNQQARQAGRSDLGSDANTAIYGLVAVSAATVGAVLAGRRPRHPVGWLLLALGLWFVYGYASWVLSAWRGAPPAVGTAVLDANVVVIPALIGFVLLLTPTGTLPSQRWRWWARVAAAAPVAGLVSLALGPFREPDQAVANPLAVGALAGPLLVVRGVALAVAALAIPVDLRAADAAAGRRLRRGGPGVRPAPGPGLPPGGGRGDPGDGGAVPASPPPHPAAGGPPLRPAPLRRRPDDPGVQRPAAPAVDLDSLAAELLAVVEQTMQPTQASLWLRPSHAASSTTGGPQRSRNRHARPRAVEAGERAGHQHEGKPPPRVALPAHAAKADRHLVPLPGPPWL